MNELVKILSGSKHEILLNRVDPCVDYLKERLALNCVHVYFTSTQTELGIRLDTANCDYSKADMSNGLGTLYLQGAITLNYDQVRCFLEVDLQTMRGYGCLAEISDSDYQRIISIS